VNKKQRTPSSPTKVIKIKEFGVPHPLQQIKVEF
jgi:hypothetical protein